MSDFPDLKINTETNDWCGGTTASPGKCDQYICNTWLAGASVSVPSIKVVFSAIHRALVANEDEGISDRPPLKFLMATADEGATDLISFIDAEGTTRASYTNTYSNTGYDAFAVGCFTNTSAPGCAPYSDDANSNTPVDASMMSPTVLSVFAVFGAGGLIGIIVTLIIVRIRKTRRKTADRHAPSDIARLQEAVVKTNNGKSKV